MDRRIIKVTDKDISNWRIPSDSNNVIIEITERTKDKITKGGVYVGHNEDVIYAEGEGSHEADVAEVWGTVAVVPDKLFFDKKYNDAMPWDTDMEVRVGDMVWFDYLASVNCDVLQTAGRTFYVIHYEDLYVAKRAGEIIPLNGYCLCEKIKRPKQGDFDITDKYYGDRVKVTYKGKPNRAYRHNDNIYGTYNNDDIGITEGSVVLLRRNFTPYRLERLEGISTFSDTPYYVIQRRNMQMVL